MAAETTFYGTLATIGTAVGGKIALVAAGFSASGPVAGSVAAAWQASIGNAVAGSLFSVLQGTAMGGVAALGVPAIVVGVCTVAVVGGAKLLT